MASLLSLSLMWMSSPSSSAWMMTPVSVPRTTRAKSCLNQPHLLMSAALLTSESKESLDHLTVPELKERLRSVGQKVTGKKSELVERLMMHQQLFTDDTAIIHKNTDSNILDASLDQLPKPLREALIRYSSSSATASSSAITPTLLPIQQKSYQFIAEGNDAVLFSPTGTGKTLAFVLPLAARLWGWKQDGSLQHQVQAQKRRFIRQRQNRNDSVSSQPVEAAMPSILIVEPSRELARQVGKVWARFHPTATKTSKHVVTVYGGVPMARHAALLGSKTDVVIGTPGRIRELIREKYLSTAHLRSIVLDEADTLLNFGDNPEVEWLLEGMVNDYQLVLASATVNKRVERFVEDVMELEIGEEGYVVLEGGDTTSDGISTINGEQISNSVTSSNTKPEVHHWSMAASVTSRIGLTADLIVTMTPRRGIVFVASKAEVEAVAQSLTERLSTANDVSIHILHGDMVQAARSRTVNAFRADTEKMTRILIATDVASRGLDLPAVDLVLQYGVPRKTGKDGTYDSELYIHRTGRAGRFGNTRVADAILMYDTAQGEGTTLTKLKEDMKQLRNIEIEPRQLPSPSEVMEASYNRALLRCENLGRLAQNTEGTQSLVQFFTDRWSKDLSFDESSEERTNDKELLLHRLAVAMAALSGLDEIVPPRSLLTADQRDRTIRVWNANESSGLSPPEVTKVVKALGSGKLGRVTICDDGSAVFDLGVKRAETLMNNVASDSKFTSEGWQFEIPSSLNN